METFKSTTTLRGIAISAVMINHYLNMNVSGDYKGFANLWISLFFIVSGYGIYCSLEKLLVEKNDLNLQNILKFYYCRIIRIFPLFLIAYFLHQLLLDKKIFIYSIIGLHGTGHFWFVPAILQCYAAAPLIYLVIIYNRLLALILILSLFIISNLIIAQGLMPGSLTKTLNFIHLNWRHTYFLYIVVFSLSMLLPKCIENWKAVSKSEKYLYLLVMFSLTMILMVCAKYSNEFGGFYDFTVLTLIPLTLITLMSIYLISNRLYVNIFSWIGKRSYSIYLFHVIYYFIINVVFEYRKNSFEELLITVTLLPVFLLFCNLTNALGNSLFSSLKKLISPFQETNS